MTNPQKTPRLTELAVNEFLDSLAGTDPTPAGGCAAALTGAMAAALTSMAARLTVGRTQYADCQDEMLRVRDRAETLGQRLAALVDEDAAAYQAVVQAYSLPRVTGAETAARTGAIQQALRRAAEVPHEIAKACAELIGLSSFCAVLGNRNVASDAAVAALLAHAGMRGAALNVRTNLLSISDASFSAAMETSLASTTAAGETALATALDATQPGA